MENLVRKNFFIDQKQLTRIKTALNAKSEKEAIQIILNQFDTELHISDTTLNLSGRLDLDRAFGEV